MLIQKPFNTIFVAKPEYLDELCRELQEIAFIMGNLVFSSQQPSDLCFALDVWPRPQTIEFSSISEAARHLRQAGKFWYLNPLAKVRRSHLIQGELRKLPELRRAFPIETPLPELGCFSLLDTGLMVYSRQRWKKWPLGNCYFIEDKTNPPNRAYLKLWEALGLLANYPKSGDQVLDLGASPGGWTSVMQSFGAQVTAVDKADLDPRVANLSNVRFLKQSAFALDPLKWESKLDWLICDLACYPDRLYELLTRWLATDKAKQYIFTIKLQGKTDLALLQKFKNLPDSRTIHLFHNKHEATFFYPAPPSLWYDK